MIYVAIPTVTPRLAACALEAIERTTPEPHRVIVARGGSHGENLDRAFAAGVPYLVNVLTDPADAYPRSGAAL